MSISKPLVMPADPEPEVLEALGLAAVRHAYLDRMLAMVIRSLSGASVADVLKATKHLGSRKLRERVGDLARDALDDGPERIRLESLLEDCAAATQVRNAFVHGVAGQCLDGGPVFVDGEAIREAPSAADIRQLAETIGALGDALRDARHPQAADPWLGCAIARAGRVPWPAEATTVLPTAIAWMPPAPGWMADFLAVRILPNSGLSEGDYLEELALRIQRMIDRAEDPDRAVDNLAQAMQESGAYSGLSVPASQASAWLIDQNGALPNWLSLRGALPTGARFKATRSIAAAVEALQRDEEDTADERLEAIAALFPRVY
jgi:hypothetical protein